MPWYFQTCSVGVVLVCVDIGVVLLQLLVHRAADGLVEEAALVVQVGGNDAVVFRRYQLYM